MSLSKYWKKQNGRPWVNSSCVFVSVKAGEQLKPAAPDGKFSVEVDVCTVHTVQSEQSDDCWISVF